MAARSGQDKTGPGHHHCSTEAAGIMPVVVDGGGDDFLEIFGGHCSSGDLFELVRRGAGANGGGMAAELQQPASSSSAPMADVTPPAAAPLPLPYELPPSEEEMAAWLYLIVRGDDELVAGHQDKPGGAVDGDIIAGWVAPAVDHPEEGAAEEHPITQGIKSGEDTARGDSSARRKTGAGARKSQHTETHNLTEKKRRCKINERFRTLKLLVPGCDKCNQASTLDQTIQYMKSLQQQIQAMSIGCSMKPASAAVYPIVQPPYLPSPAVVAAGLPPAAAIAPGMLVRGHVLGSPPAIVPFAPMLPVLRHHPAAVMVPAAAPMLYPNATPLPAARRTRAEAAGSRKSKTFLHQRLIEGEKHSSDD
ncbi:hypothetical protein ACP4OV_022909 [Aristida adscensionis]